MKLIDAEETINNIEEGIREDFPAMYHALCRWIMRQTTVDAVPVVRCRDCLYFQQLGRCGARSESYTDPDGFCHMGVKKEEET